MDPEQAQEMEKCLYHSVRKLVLALAGMVIITAILLFGAIGQSFSKSLILVANGNEIGDG